MPNKVQWDNSNSKFTPHRVFGGQLIILTLTKFKNLKKGTYGNKRSINSAANMSELDIRQIFGR